MLLFSASRLLIIGVIIGVLGAVVKDRILRCIKPDPSVPRILYNSTPITYAAVPLYYNHEACQ